VITAEDGVSVGVEMVALLFVAVMEGEGSRPRLPATRSALSPVACGTQPCAFQATVITSFVMDPSRGRESDRYHNRPSETAVIHFIQSTSLHVTYPTGHTLAEPLADIGVTLQHLAISGPV
jgi:hypothetical protein